IFMMSMWRTQHPYLGFVYTPKINQDKFQAFHSKYPITNFGYVDTQPPIHKRAPGKLVVAIIGGSVALGFGLDGDEMLTRELKKHEEYKDREIEYVRLGLGGHKQPQQLLTMAYLLSLGAEFDLVINIDGFNEIALPPIENVPAGVYPFFPRAWHFISGDALSREQQELVGLRAVNTKWRRDLAAWFRDSVFRYSVTLQLLWKIRDRSYSGAIGHASKALRDQKPEDRSFRSLGPGMDGIDKDRLHAQLARQWRAASVQLHHLCRENGILYLHFLQPNQYVEGSKHIGPVEHKIAWEEKGDYRKHVVLGYPHLIDEGRKLVSDGVDFHDLTGIFRGYEKPLYVDTCCHFNREGQEIMAKRIAAAVREATDRRASEEAQASRTAKILVSPPSFRLDDPFYQPRIALSLLRSDGSHRPVRSRAIGASWSSADPKVARVTAEGVVVGMRSGTTTLTLSKADESEVRTVPVTVVFPKALAFGTGVPGTGGKAPLLVLGDQPANANTVAVVEIHGARARASGVLLIATAPVATAGSGLLLSEKCAILPLSCDGNPNVPGSGHATVKIPMGESGGSGIAYFQAMLRDPEAPGGWSISNALRVELGTGGTTQRR
ncbi:MAG: hypothetical protein KDC87_10290, partial [Planctomycetes bacterium]|nr:hypothetical protein [Planctomycetota bacterium]